MTQSKSSLKKIQFINYLKTLRDDAKSTPGSNQRFRINSYNNTIKILESYKGDFDTKDDITKIIQYIRENGIKDPKSTRVKLIEFFDTGKIKDAESLQASGELNPKILFQKIYGVGVVKANELFKKYKLTTISELRKEHKKNPDLLNEPQKLGLKYFEDLNERVPREEINEFYDIVKNIICKENELNEPKTRFSINGSYRRGYKTSGDIDLLISHPNTKKVSEIRQKLIKALFDKKILIETLASGKKKFMGIACIDKKARHIDIIETKPETFPFAQLYFTGSSDFNAYMRGIALKKGYTLNEYNLGIIDPKTEKKKPLTKKQIMKKLGKPTFETENDIFNFLDMEFVSPEAREIKQ